jgi:AcrR family transcriptional regulator
MEQLSRCPVDFPAVTVAPLFERPTREHALRLADATFGRGERVDMLTLAAQLGVGRSTLYRWVGDRERLLGDLVASNGQATWERAIAKSRGTGADRAFDAIRIFVEQTSSFAPLRSFAEREPAMALRVLMAPRGAVSARITDGIGLVLTEATGVRITDELRSAIELTGSVAAAFQWSLIAAGLDIDTARVLQTMRALIEPALLEALAEQTAV